MRLVSAIYPDWYPFDALFKERIASSEPLDLNTDDVLLVWGGEDISPALYREPLNVYGGGDPNPSRRDRIEWDMMKMAVDLDVPIIGVCRGAQMLCALAGGSLWQDVTGHGGHHLVDTYDNKRLITNSMHHQMMRLDNMEADDYELIAWTHRHSKVYHHGYNSVHLKSHGEVDPEFVYFPKVKGFAIQWHPEFEDYPDEATDYVFNVINEKLGVLV